jgi:predicted dinucleotide-binding enzyme
MSAKSADRRRDQNLIPPQQPAKRKRIMTYAIIGSGAIGTALATQFARNDIDVLVANSRGPASLADLVGRLGKNIKAASVQEAVKANIVILAVPFGSVPETVRDAAAWNGRIIVDATNAIDFPAFTPKDLGGRLSTDVVADFVPGARVVKAFNTLPAAVLASDPAKDGGHRVVFLSGNDAAAKADVATLIKSVGFAAIDLGKFAEGRLAQFGGPLMVHNLLKHD